MRTSIRPLVSRLRSALLFSAGLMAISSATTHAAPPRPVLSTSPSPVVWDVPPVIPVFGHDAVGVADPLGEFVLVIRDFALNPIAGATVTLDFSSCADLRLCVDPHDASAVVNCAQGTLAKVTDQNGRVRFRVVGCSVAAPGTAGAGASCAAVYADGVLGGFVPVAIYDLAGCDGLAPGDASAWLTDYFSNLSPARGDYDANGQMGAGDLSRWLVAFFANGSVANCSNGGRCGP
ncbi:MAG: hypothetical protein ABIS67_00535 [Candidatus Eisenbacteria bacterium]